MGEQFWTGGPGGGQRILRKVAWTLLTGGTAYLVTNLAEQPVAWQLTLSAFVGGIALVVQFLTEFDNRIQGLERRLSSHFREVESLVDRGFSKINKATELFGLVEASALRTDEVMELVRYSTAIPSQEPSLVNDFAQAEIRRMSEFLKELGEGGVAMYDGEDRDWLLGLAHNARHTIEAVSLPAVDAGGSGVDDGFWSTDLGHRYLKAQREARGRGVIVQRIFVRDEPGTADQHFRRQCRSQVARGIDVRVLDMTNLNPALRSELFDFIIFDGVLSYESTPSSLVHDYSRPRIINTRLVLRREFVDGRKRLFAEIWQAARPWREIDTHEADGAGVGGLTGETHGFPQSGKDDVVG